MSEKLVRLRDYPQAHTLILGAIIGDIIGSPYEWPKEKRITYFDFPLFSDESRFTDDTVLTMAVINALVDAKRANDDFKKIPFADYYRKFVQKYPDRGYSSRFMDWINGTGASDSFGNGASMRISPIAYACGKNSTLALNLTRIASECTHNNPEALEAARLVAFGLNTILYGGGTDQKTLFRELSGSQKIENMPKSLHSILPDKYKNDYGNKSISAAVPSVPQAIACFLSSHSFENAIRYAVGQGFDADTQASIAGALALPYYRVMPGFIMDSLPPIPEEFCLLLEEFSQLFKVGKIHII